MPMRIVTDAATLDCGKTAVARRVWAAQSRLLRQRLSYGPSGYVPSSLPCVRVCGAPNAGRAGFPAVC